MSACPTGKKQHPTKEIACIVLKKSKNKGLNVYKCDRCKMWHLGNSASPIRKLARMNQLFDRIHK